MFVNAQQLRILILDLQDQHCQSCKFKSAAYTYCYNNCLVGKRIQHYGIQLSTQSEAIEQSEDVQKKKLHWDVLCEQALQLQHTHHTYRAIAFVLQCDDSGLRKQLKKRGLLFASRTKSRKNTYQK